MPDPQHECNSTPLSALALLQRPILHTKEQSRLSWNSFLIGKILSNKIFTPLKHESEKMSLMGKLQLVFLTYKIICFSQRAMMFVLFGVFVQSLGFVLLIDGPDCMFCLNRHAYMVISHGMVWCIPLIVTYVSSCHCKDNDFLLNIKVDLQFPVLHTKVAFCHKNSLFECVWCGTGGIDVM